jgi:hypothetical protein
MAMAVAVARGVMNGAVVAAALVVCPPIAAADIGGWFAEQQKAGAQSASTPDACPTVVARAAADATAASAYEAALCYLQSDAPDLVAAKAWLAQASTLNHLQARRMLHSLQIAEAALHSPLRHCHDLGEGRQICHGGARPVAATVAK